jgi:hypothetical protein
MIGYETRDTDTDHEHEPHGHESYCKSSKLEIPGKLEKRTVSGMGFGQEPVEQRRASFSEASLREVGK